MPVLRESKYLTPYVVYDAPVNEKTEEIRRIFDVDPETGYPRHYNWRSLAKLGKEYRPEDAFEKLLPYREEAMYSTYIANGAIAVVLSALVQAFYNTKKARPYYSRPWVFLGMLTWTGAVAAYNCIRTPNRQGMENAMYIDYVKSHPDRFETKKRYKLREVLFWNDLIR